MPDVAFCLFDTAVGPCAVAWSGGGLVMLQLPERDEAVARARVRRRLPDAVEAEPPPAVAEAIAAMTELLDRGRRDLSDVGLDMSGVPAFERGVYEAARAIPPGRTVTYGELAERLGDRGLARAVGQALGRNPFPIVVPCHRVLGADGRLGGFSAPGGRATKLRLLEIERARTSDAPDLFLDASPA
jgi:methylated-DNA-[protein]-cysteine S-methyltransferase